MFLLFTGATYCLQEHLSGGNVRTFLEMQYGHYYLHGNIDALVPSAFFRFALNITSGVHFLHSHGVLLPLHFFNVGYICKNIIKQILTETLILKGGFVGTFDQTYITQSAQLYPHLFSVTL